jgi:DNA-binding GntR family transcriptional regulator
VTAAATAMTPQELSRLLERFSRPGVPKYTALRDAVVHAVASGQFAPGDRVPNEQELAGVLPISLGTIQRALRQLVDEGVVQRRQGQGSFIAGRTDDAEMSQPFHCRFVDDSGSAYLPVYPEANGRRMVKGPADWEKVLGGSEALEITRRIRIGTEFAVFSSFVVDAKRLPVFASLPLKKLNGENFKDVIFRASGQAIQRVDLFLRQARVPEHVAKAIDVGPRTDCLALRAIAYLGESEPIYYQQIFIPPTQRELHIVADNRARGFR